MTLEQATEEAKTEFSMSDLIEIINSGAIESCYNKLKVEIDTYEGWEQAAFTQLQMEYVDNDQTPPTETEAEAILKTRYIDYVNNCAISIIRKELYKNLDK